MKELEEMYDLLMVYILSENTGMCLIYKISHITHHIINFLCIRDSCSGMPAIDK